MYDILVLLAYQTTFNSRVIDVLSEWGSLYVLLKDGRVSGADNSFSSQIQVYLSRRSPLPPFLAHVVVVVVVVYSVVVR